LLFHILSCGILFMPLKFVNFSQFKSVRDNVTKIAIPAIGAGLGGLKWEEVKDVLNRVSADYPAIELYVVEAYHPSDL
ncbi:MAG: hypothetical protein K2M54_09705, partial [Muribaculaceae bacterium]|nr:hypothetical protein [Muribaculaceae bacterium]